MNQIVTIGGGTGQYALLSGLKTIPDLKITAIVTMADSGGSSGVLRTERGTLPPGDILRCLLALATADEDVIQLFKHRLSKGGGVGGHTIGNIALIGAAEQRGDFCGGIETLEKILKPRGRVLPVTTDNVQLRVELEDGTQLLGEHRVDRRGNDGRGRIRRVWLDPPGCAHPKTISAIETAQALVVGPGDLFTSIIPNVLVAGVVEAITRSRARVIFVVNAMTKRGETDGFSAKRFVETFEFYARHRVDVVLCNTRRPAPDVFAKYEREGAQIVEPPPELMWDGRTVAPFPLLSDSSLARHDSIKLAHIIRALI